MDPGVRRDDGSGEDMIATLESRVIPDLDA
jgi:hypothetical protein